MNNNKELSVLTASAGEAVRRAAEFIRGEMGKVQPGQIEEKFLNGLVSYVDRTAETMLVEDLSHILPEAGYITEEGTVETSDAALKWIIDPLDGTTNFLHGVPHFSISVALAKGTEILLGIIHHVPQGEHFTAWQNGGAYLNGQPIRVSERKMMREALVVTGLPYHNLSKINNWFGSIEQFVKRARALRRFGSAALDLAYVACGRFDIFFEYGLSPWDVAAGILLVREAGGEVSDFQGNPDCLFLPEMLACSRHVYPEALDIVRGTFG